MRVLVSGGKDYDKNARVFNVLTQFHETSRITLIINGGLSGGVDYASTLWAKNHNVPVMHFKVNAEKRRKLGRKAGMMRNYRMIEEGRPDFFFCFPGNSETKDLVYKAQRAGVLTAMVDQT